VQDLRVITGEEQWPRRIAISLPVPLGLTARILRWRGMSFGGFDETEIDDLILALEASLSADQPIYIEVDEGESGEKVKIILG
jgi:hypothetical protein